MHLFSGLPIISLVKINADNFMMYVSVTERRFTIAFYMSAIFLTQQMTLKPINSVHSSEHRIIKIYS